MKSLKSVIRNTLKVFNARRRIKLSEFTIVSNNCWGAHIYQLLGMEYKSPFVGLFIYPDSYLHLLENYWKMLNSELRFVQTSKDKLPGWDYPVGVLDGVVEVHFLHYSSEEEARTKWNRRLERVVHRSAQTFLKFCDRDGCSPHHAARFDDLPFNNKVFFSARPFAGIQSNVVIPSNDDCVPDGLQLSQLAPSYFDTIAWLNDKGLSGNNSAKVHALVKESHDTGRR